MNNLKKATLLILVFANSLFYASNNNKPSLSARAKKLLHSIPHLAKSTVWDNKGKIVGVCILSWLSKTYGQAQVMVNLPVPTTTANKFPHAVILANFFFFKLGWSQYSVTLFNEQRIPLDTR